MQIVRTILWVLLTAFVVMFVMINYGQPQRVIIWPTSTDAFGFDWPVGIIALVFFLLGAVPMWAYHRSVRWAQSRRIRTLENSVKANALAHRPETEHTETVVDDRPTKPPVHNPVDRPAETGDNLTPTTRDTDGHRET